jgi:hypothetical protein
MFGSSMLEVAIGVIFVYLLLSLICTALNEAIASLLQKRGRNLFEGIKNLLNDPTFTGLAQQLYNHGLIGGISQHASNPNEQTRRPSYMSPENFSLALLDILGIRGVIAAQYGDLLEQAEKADDAYEEARKSAAAAPGNSQFAQAADLAQQTQAQAQAALQTLADKAKTAYELATQAANEASGNAELARRAVEARTNMDHIDAALKLLEARRAAIASSKNPREATLLLNAGTTLRKALDFGRALAAQSPDPLGNIQEGLRRLPEGHTRESLQVILDKTRREVDIIEHQAEAFRRNLEGWFNDAMNRVGGWYKRWTQAWLIGLATVIVIGSNVDTIMLVQRLLVDDALRASLAAAAQDTLKTRPGAAADAGLASRKSGGELAENQNPEPGIVKTPPVPESSGNQQATTSMSPEDKDIQKLVKSLESLKLPIGWSWDPGDPRYFRFLDPKLSWDFPTWRDYGMWVLSKLFGLFISILAISLGAPFWFDTLSKVMNVRSTGTPPGETRKSAPQKSSPQPGR